MKSVFGFTLVALTLVAQVALAQGDGEAKAREYYKTGTAQFEGGHYLDAQAAFAAGYELSHKPGFLWNMAECARLLGNRARALELYRRYLTDAPADAPQREEAERRARELGAERPPAAPPTTSAAPPRARAPAPTTPSPLTSAAPPPSLSLRPKLALSPPRDAGTESPSKPITSQWWFWTGAGAVVVGGVVTAILLSSGSSSAAPTPAGTYVTDWRRP